MRIVIRTEESKDHDKVREVIEHAFANVKESDQSEGGLVTRLRQSEAYVPELSLVALLDNEIAGHILFTEVKIRSSEQVFNQILALAPVSVHPNHQGKGIGTELIEKGHEIARRLGFKGVVLLGHEGYYPRFGYVPASRFGIKAPWDVPDKNYMALPLVPEGLDSISGTVEYANAFFE